MIKNSLLEKILLALFVMTVSFCCVSLNVYAGENDEKKMIENVIKVKDLYSIDRTNEQYHNTFRNPFSDYIVALESEGEIKEISTKDKIINNLPFKLTGIIGSDDSRIAIVEMMNESSLLYQGDEINEFKIMHINKYNVLFNYNGFEFLIDLRGDKSDH